MSTPEAQRAINRGASTIIPCLLIGTVGVATYVVVARLGGKWFHVAVSIPHYGEVLSMKR